MEDWEPYETKYFDHKRHFERKESEKVEPASLDALLKLDFITTVDDTMLEARSMIQQWMDGGQLNAQDLELDLSLVLAPNRSTENDAMDEAKRILNEIKFKENKSTAALDLGLGMKVRRRAVQKNPKIHTREQRGRISVETPKPMSKPLLKNTKKVEKVRQAVLERVLEQELRAQLDCLPPAAESGNGTMIQPKTVVELTHTTAVNSLEKTLEKEKEERLRMAYKTADMRYQSHCLCLKRKFISSLINQSQRTRSVLQTITNRSSFYSKVTLFSTWKKATRSKQSKRQLQFEMEELRIETRNTIKANMHYRLLLLFRGLENWKRFVEKQKMERQVRDQTRRRKEGIQSYLKSLEERFQKQRAESSENTILPSPAVALDDSIESDTPTTKCKDSVDLYCPKSTCCSKDVTEKSAVSLVTEPTSTNPRPKSIIHKHKPKLKRVLKTDTVFLQSLQQREAERQARKQKLVELKQEREKQRAIEKEQEMEAKREQERAEREALLQEKKRIEEETRKLMEERRIQKEREREMVQHAALIYHHKILRNYGFFPWKRMIQQQNQDMVNAIRKHELYLQQSAWCCLGDRIRRKEELKLQRADQVRNSNLKRHFWKKLKALYGAHTVQIAVADRQFKNKTLIGAFRQYCNTARIHEKLRMEAEKIQNVKADRLAVKLVPKRMLRRWKDFVKEQKEGRWRQYRIERMREIAKNTLVGSSLEKRDGLVEGFVPTLELDINDITLPTDSAAQYESSKTTSFGLFDFPEFKITE